VLHVGQQFIFFYLFSLSIIHVLESQDINLIPSLNTEMNITRSRRGLGHYTRIVLEG